MTIISYFDYWELVDELDLVFKNRFPKWFFAKILSSTQNFQYIYNIHSKNSTHALQIIALLLLQQKHGNYWVYINPKEKCLVKSETSIITLKSFVLYKYNKKRIRISKFIEYD